MGTSRFCSLTDEQFLALFLYAKKQFPNNSTFRSFITSGPNFPHIFDLAEDFDKSLRHNDKLSKCYEMVGRIMNE